jgi:hypothetical protein
VPTITAYSVEHNPVNEIRHAITLVCYGGCRAQVDHLDQATLNTAF